jgi:nucleoside-diphosphate-sugar epimerase
MKKYLILGAGSAIARYFTSRLKSEGSLVYELSSNKGKRDAYRLDSIKDKINTSNPEVIINFAGTYTDDYDESYLVNVLISKNLFNAAVEESFKGKIILIGSASEYGDQEKYTEECIEKPISVYGLTKLMQHSLFIGNLSMQLKLILEGRSKEIRLGNLNSYRDFLFIDDVYDGFMNVIEKGNNGEVYNLGMGKSIFLGDFVSNVQKELGLKVKLAIEEMDYIGKIEKKVVADINKIKRISWSPKFDYNDLIKEFCKRLKEVED